MGLGSRKAISMNLGLEGRSFIVSGSSRGIGRAIAKALLDEGTCVVLTGRNKNGLEEAGQALSANVSPGSIALVPGDMTDAGTIQAAVDEALNRWGQLDGIVANLGDGTSLPGFDIPLSHWREAMDVNLFGSAELARRALPHLESTRGTVTFVSSIAGVEALGAPVAYASAKSALNMLTKSLARQVGPSGVRVNAVAPGNIFFEGGTWDRKVKEEPIDSENMIRKEVPLQRFGRPEEIADVVTFLASDRASYVTGAVWIVDGGQTRSMV